jgi:hypothetical protein
LAFLIETAMPLERMSQEIGKEIRIPARISANKLVQLNKLLKENPGEVKVTLVFVDKNRRERRIPLSFGINYQADLIKKIREVIVEK